MAHQHLKLAKGLGNFVPQSINFSELEREMEEKQVDYHPSDEGMARVRAEENLAFEEMVVNILSNLELREGLVFVFELLRDDGYRIDHGAFARAIHISRRQYMRVLDDVRLKSQLFLIGRRRAISQAESHKDE